MLCSIELFIILVPFPMLVYGPMNESWIKQFFPIIQGPLISLFIIFEA